MVMESKISKISDISKIPRKSCTGCGACRSACPCHAISMQTDNEGFWYPRIDDDSCINCGKCAKACPLCASFDFSNDGKTEDCRIYAAWSLHPEIRYESTSGGIFSELADSFMKNGGFVCGAVYDERNMVRHMVSDNTLDLKKLRQSKYVQSDMGDVYQEIAGLLRQGKNVLFCGTPCQCAGVYRYCYVDGAGSENLWLVDFICRGSNSPKVYRKFLDELEQRYRSDIARVWFKNKAYGWNRFSTRVEMENGEYYLEDRYHDVYIRGYIEENLYIRPSCMDCKYKGFHRVSDITLADFWAVELENQNQDTDKGTSMVMLHTDKGNCLWDSISHTVYKTEKNLDDVTKGNVCFYESVPPGRHREEFMQELDNIPVIDNIARFLKNGG